VVLRMWGIGSVPLVERILRKDEARGSSSPILHITIFFPPIFFSSVFVVLVNLNDVFLCVILFFWGVWRDGAVAGGWLFLSYCRLH